MVKEKLGESKYCSYKVLIFRDSKKSLHSPVLIGSKTNLSILLLSNFFQAKIIPFKRIIELPFQWISISPQIHETSNLLRSFYATLFRHRFLQEFFVHCLNLSTQIYRPSTIKHI